MTLAEQAKSARDHGRRNLVAEAETLFPIPLSCYLLFFYPPKAKWSSKGAPSFAEVRQASPIVA